MNRVLEELTTQTGHAPDDWPLVVLKELVDNALDACEEGGAAPIIHVRVGADGITVADNGPGIPAETVRGVLDFATRVSSREAYVAPDRGAQGNGLMTILAMPFVLDGEVGVVEVTGCGVHHVITIKVNQLLQEPVIDHHPVAAAGNAGTVVRLGWPDSARSTLEAAKPRFLQVWSQYGFLNPHLTGTLEWFAEEPLVIEATDTGWQKWTPSQPTSPHWYKPDQFERLISGYLANADRCDRTVRDGVAEFRGLSGTAKQKAILEATGLSRQPLSALLDGEGLDHEAVAELLAVMQAASKPVRPELLGVIGKSHVTQRLTDLGCLPDSVAYAKLVGDDDGVPWVVEQAFGYRAGDAAGGVIIAGVNWSPALGNPFRKLDDYGISLDGLLERQRIRKDEPVVVFVDLAQAHVSYTDRGKSAVVVNGKLGEAIIKGVQKTTAKWAKQRKAEERDSSAARYRQSRMTRIRTVTMLDVARDVMESAYLHASGGGTLPPLARQVMYAARPEIQARTGLTLNDDYFTQELLPKYIREYGVDHWDIVFDARGRLEEPHTQRVVPLGTLDVRRYITDVAGGDPEPPKLRADETYKTIGPQHRYGALLFIEKEGFMPLIQAAHIAERFDIAVMSSKGMQSTACRRTADELCGRYDIPLLVMHDFDKAGFSMLGMFRHSNDRYKYKTQ